MYTQLKGVRLAHHITLSDESRSVLEFWLHSFDTYNGVAPIWRPTALYTVRISTDAAGHSSTSNGGWAGILQAPGHTQPLIARDSFSFSTVPESSTLLELEAVRLTLFSFFQQGYLPSGVSVLLKGDNEAACSILSKGSSCSPACHVIAKQIFWFCFNNDIRLLPTWVPRTANQLADFYSKYVDKSDIQLSPSLFRMLSSRWGPFHIDLFASPRTAHLKQFYSWFYTPEASGTNAFAFTWSSDPRRPSWCYPPFRLIARTLAHASKCQAHLCLIVPFWPGAKWWHTLLASSHTGSHFRGFVRDVVVLHNSAHLFCNAPAPSWPLLALRIFFPNSDLMLGPPVPTL